MHTTMLVSIIMPAYNAASYIEKAIASVQAQTYTDWELIVVDDCSTDATAEIAGVFARQDERIRLIRNERNRGVAAARNAGLAASSGCYVAFLDSDDSWYPKKLETQISYLQQTGADLCYTSYCIVDTAGNRIRGDYIVPDRTDYESLLKENVILCSSVVLSGEIARAHAFYLDCYHEDYLFWLTLLKDGVQAVGCRQILADWCYRKHSRSYNKLHALRKRWCIYRQTQNLSFIQSLRYLMHYSRRGLQKYRRRGKNK